jgi:hypothetical protein|nr:MAG TPA: hypothetical protein [Bacteriophage sp.]
MNKSMFVATLRGKGVWRECALFKIIADTQESTLNNLAKDISSQYEINVSDFHYNHGNLTAQTSNENITIYIEEVNL